MKKTIWFKVLLVVILPVTLSNLITVKAVAVPMSAAPVTLAWDASTDAAVAGYALYYHLANSSVTSRRDLGTAILPHSPILKRVPITCSSQSGMTPRALKVLRPIHCGIARRQCLGSESPKCQIARSTFSSARQRVRFAASSLRQPWHPLNGRRWAAQLRIQTVTF